MNLLPVTFSVASPEPLPESTRQPVNELVHDATANFFADLKRDMAEVIELQSTPWRSQRRAAFYCQCDTRVIRRAVADGDLPEHYCSEGKPIYDIKDLDALIEKVTSRKREHEKTRGRA